MPLPWTVFPDTKMQMAYVEFDSGSLEELANTTEQAIGVADQWSLCLNGVMWTVDSGSTSDIMQIADGGQTANYILLQGNWSGANRHLVVALQSSGGISYKTLTYNNFFPGLGVGNGVHIVVTYDGSTAGDPVTVYKNGAVVAFDSGTNNNGTQTDSNRQVVVGAGVLAAWSDVRLGPIYLWNTVLSATEARTLYAKRNTGMPTVALANLKHWWPIGVDTTSATTIGQDLGKGTRINIGANATAITAADCFRGSLVP